MATFFRGTLALGGALLLGGCLGNDGGVTRLGTEPFWFNTAAPGGVVLAGSGIRISGPDGYCVEPRTTAEGDGTSAILGSCGALANSALAGRPASPALLTAAVSGAGSAMVDQDPDAFLDFLNSPDGRETLGAGKVVDVLASDITPGAVAINIRSAPTAGGVERVHWRGFLDVGDRLVTISVYSLKSRPLPPAAGRRLLEDFAMAIRRQNGSSVSELPPNA